MPEKVINQDNTQDVKKQVGEMVSSRRNTKKSRFKNEIDQKNGSVIKIASRIKKPTVKGGDHIRQILVVLLIFPDEDRIIEHGEIKK